MHVVQPPLEWSIGVQGAILQDIIPNEALILSHILSLILSSL